MSARKTTAAARRRHMTPAEIVAAEVVPGSADECWPWSGRVNRWGYGRLSKFGREIMVHRVAYELAHGPIPDGQVVRHSCDNPPCCNPAHLLVGSSADNRLDCVSRERHTRGELCPGHKLTESDVRAIRVRSQQGETYKALGLAYGVTATTARKAATGRNWKHVGLLDHGAVVPA